MDFFFVHQQKSKTFQSAFVLLFSVVSCKTFPVPYWLFFLKSHVHYGAAHAIFLQCSLMSELKLLCMIQEQSQGRQASSSDCMLAAANVTRDKTGEGAKRELPAQWPTYSVHQSRADTVSHRIVCTCSPPHWPWVWSVRPLCVGLITGNTQVHGVI